MLSLSSSSTVYSFIVNVKVSLIEGKVFLLNCFYNYKKLSFLFI